MQLRIILKAARLLVDQVGIKQFLRYIPGYLAHKRKKTPWTGLDLPKEQKDKKSRQMIQDAVIFYKLLLGDYPQPQAFEIIKEVVFQSAITQLKLTIPRIRREKLLKMSNGKQLQFFTKLAEKFYNADWEVLSSPEELENQTFSIRITRCRFVELVRQVGYPELSGIFCHGDLAYFENFQPEIDFARPKNIGVLGNATCDFVFTLK